MKTRHQSMEPYSAAVPSGYHGGILSRLHTVDLARK